jgi:hypothetical protein
MGSSESQIGGKIPQHTESEAYIMFFHLTYTKLRLIQLNGLLPKQKNVIVDQRYTRLDFRHLKYGHISTPLCPGTSSEHIYKNSLPPALGLGLSGPNTLMQTGQA